MTVKMKVETAGNVHDSRVIDRCPESTIAKSNAYNNEYYIQNPQERMIIIISTFCVLYVN